jgi:hypothetical protein
MPRSKVAQDTIAARRARVAEGRLRGMTLAELGRQEQVDKSTISRDLESIRAEWRQFFVESMEQIQNQTAQRYDVLLGAVWDRAEAGDLDAIAAVLQIEGNRRRLLGLDAPHHDRLTVATERRSTTTNLDTLMASLPSEMVAALGLVARVIEVTEEQTAGERQSPQVVPPTVA